MVVSLFVSGIPVQQGSMIPGRPVKTAKGMRSTMHSHNSAELKAWRTLIATKVRQTGHPVIGPYVAVEMCFYMPRPGTTKYPLWPAGTPDVDKLARAVLDALTESGLIEDDARVVRLNVDEEWTDPDAHPSPGLVLHVHER